MGGCAFRLKGILLTRGVVGYFSLTHCMVILILFVSAIRVKYYGVGIDPPDVNPVSGTNEMAGVSTVSLNDADK